MTKTPLKGSYEFVFILKEKKESITSFISDIISKIGGKVVSQKEWGNKTFAYKIKHTANGYYFLWKIELPNEAVIKFRKELNMSDEVLRYLLLKE